MTSSTVSRESAPRSSTKEDSSHVRLFHAQLLGDDLLDALYDVIHWKLLPLKGTKKTKGSTKSRGFLYSIDYTAIHMHGGTRDIRSGR